ncbi:MAG: hypothetical protein H7A32_01235 [Deltaproteobacteria bacterium]|nr:hypothetical protein [Deltaproteobacteria bacterium]
MKNYFALVFLPNSPTNEKALLSKWLIREQNEVKKSQALFQFKVGDQEQSYTSPISGIFKAYLYKEGEEIETGRPIAVFEISEEEQKQALEESLGKVITPDEANQGMSYVEAASIRMPG